jgi:hypothetical protein
MPTGGGAGRLTYQKLSNGKYLMDHENSGVVCNNVMADGGIEADDGTAISTAIKTAESIRK